MVRYATNGRGIGGQVAKGKEMDFLNEFTKKEIIEWIRQDIHFHLHPPKKSELLFIRWQTRSKELEKKAR